MTTITIEEAQAKLPELIGHRQPGEEIAITDRGQTLAHVRKAEPIRTQPMRPGPGLGKGMITIISDDDDHLEAFAEYMS